MYWRHLTGILITLGGLLSFAGTACIGGEIEFSRDIRPLLSGKCLKCHGPDEDAREAGLRLDTADGLYEDLGGYSPIVAGEPGASEAIRRILSNDPDLVMPPPNSGKELSKADKDLLVEWVKQGAEWEQHWAFIPPRDPPIPPVSRTDWCRNEIDRFVLARLDSVGLNPAVDAEPYILVRRLYLDLIGIPPTPKEADTWVERIWMASTTDGSKMVVDEAAYQELISSLLESPQYGERWAKPWLDLARYADTNGYEKDRERTIWPYRDWVIQSLNADLPFDQFTLHQIAGDMLPDASQEQKIATGFHRNTMLNEEGGIDPLEFRYHAVADRVATTGTTWLGLTLGCCQCHTHKYDPISHTEYFQFMAYLNNADEPELPLDDQATDQIWRENLKRADALLEKLANQWPVPDRTIGKDDKKARTEKEGPPKPNHERQQDRLAADSDSEQSETDSDEELRARSLENAFRAWLAKERENATVWDVLPVLKATSNLPILTIQEDNSILATGDTAKRDDYYITYRAGSQPIHALQLEAIPDDRLPAGGPGSTYYEGTRGDFFLTELQIDANEKSIAISSATESYAKNRFGKNPVSAALAIDGDVQTGWSVDQGQGSRHTAVFNLSSPIAPETTFTIHMVFGRHFASSLGRFRFAASADTHQPAARAYSTRISQLLRQPGASLSQADMQRLRNEFLLTAPELADASAKIRELQRRPPVTTTLVMSERPPAHTRVTYRHHRGEYLQSREVVTAGTPEVLHSSQAYPANRLGLAKWIVSPDNPLTGRVVANRAWATFFGTGIVETVDDFGLQGSSPSHPELLDWLALRLVHDDQWSIKKLHRRIVSSSTYRQSSDVNHDAIRIDAGNRLISFAPRLRLEAEVLRDSLLVAAGVLSTKPGGPPVRPLQPAGVTEVAYGSPNWAVSDGEARYRRSIYTFMKRTAPFAMFSTFDAPSGEACVARRDRSNSPLQALTLLNDVMILDLARLTGESLFADKDRTRQERITELFRRTTARPPSQKELAALGQFFDKQMAAFANQPDQAKKLAGEVIVGRVNTDEERAELAAWIAAARAVFGLDETQTRE